MIRRVGILFLLVLVTASTAVAAGQLEGRWRLVEQRYGEGRANQAAEELPVRLEFAHERGRLVGHVWAGDERAQASDWPALVVAGESRTLLVDERRLDAVAGEVLARYRVQPAPGDGLVLEITEHYKLTPDGESLAGTVEVSFVRDGKPGGGYLLHRRFAREP